MKLKDNRISFEDRVARLKRIQELLAEGQTYTEIQKAVGCDRNDIATAKELLGGQGQASAVLSKSEFFTALYDEFIKVAKKLPSSSPPTVKEVFFKKKHDEEEACLLLSDMHIGQKTEVNIMGGLGEYNYEIFKKEMKYYKKSLASIFDIIFSSVPCKTVNIFSIGDIIESQLLRASQLRTTDLGLIEQIMAGAEEITELIRWLAGIFPQVNCYVVPGNHDRPKKEIGELSPKDSFSYLIWVWVRERVSGLGNVKVAISDSWFQIVQRMGFTFWVEHGDAFRSYLGVPYYGMVRGKARIEEMLKGYVSESSGKPVSPDYLLFGHIHTSTEFERIITNGSWTGADEYSARHLHRGSAPVQRMFTLHPKKGITSHRPVQLEDRQTREVAVVS